jgi:hypothetical protein
MPLFVGEWGGPDTVATGRPWSDVAVEVFDENRASWTNWSYDERSQKCAGIGPGYCTAFYQLVPDAAQPGWYVRNGHYQENAVALYARPFPRAVAGMLARFAYDAASRTLTVTGTLNGDHDVSAPALTYPAGVTARCDGRTVPASASEGFVRVRCAGAELRLEAAAG